MSWQEFLRGKKYKRDVSKFALNFIDNILELHADLKNKKYRHGGYKHFKITDPKPRDIHKASVRDRLIHHAIYRILYPYFDKKFIYDSYSCRNNKGTHKAINRFRTFSRIVSKNYKGQCFVLKCDIKKFFASIDHEILIQILEKHITDKDIIGLLNQIIQSFHTNKNLGVGLPLGNLTSQLLVNIYMNEFDHFVKRELKQKYYIRYADDFVFLNTDREELKKLIPEIKNFLWQRLKLKMHPNKVFIKSYYAGIDFLGWVHFSKHRVLRNSTKRRIFKRLNYQIRENDEINENSRQSYLGLLSHGNCYKVQQKIRYLL